MASTMRLDSAGGPVKKKKHFPLTYWMVPHPILIAMRDCRVLSGVTTLGQRLRVDLEL